MTLPRWEREAESAVRPDIAYDWLTPRGVLYCSVKCAVAAGESRVGLRRLTEAPDDFNERYGALCPTCEETYHLF